MLQEVGIGTLIFVISIYIVLKYSPMVPIYYCVPEVLTFTAFYCHRLYLSPTIY
jgi:hypothetical protein